MDNNKKKIFAIIVTAVISLLIAAIATVFGIDPDDLFAALPDSGVAGVSGVIAVL